MNESIQLIAEIQWNNNWSLDLNAHVHEDHGTQPFSTEMPTDAGILDVVVIPILPGSNVVVTREQCYSTDDVCTEELVDILYSHISDCFDWSA